MASINGISVKGMKEFKGHEGEPLFQGNLYLNNKKIGFWSQDTWGAICDNFVMENGYSEELLRDAIRKLYPNTSLDFLMGDYISLYEDEKMYKNAVKKGYAGIVVASDGYHQVGWSLPASYMRKTDEELLKELDSDIKEAKQSFFAENEYTKHTIKIYRTPTDFMIGEPIDLEIIKRKPKLNETLDSCARSEYPQTKSINSDREER